MMNRGLGGLFASKWGDQYKDVASAFFTAAPCNSYRDCTTDNKQILCVRSRARV